jgi:hypothetical protein
LTPHHSDVAYRTIAKGSGQAWVEKHCWKSLDDEDDYEEKDPLLAF